LAEARYAATAQAVETVLQTFRVLIKSRRRHLAAKKKAPRTVQTFTESLSRFVEFLIAQGMLSDPAVVSREHVESFIAHLLTRHKRATASNRYRALQTFFRWLVEEGEVTASPMVKMRPPANPETLPEVLSEPQVARLLKACDGTAFVRLLLDTDMRRAEFAGLKVEDLDLENNVAVVMGKGRRPRVCPFGGKTAVALDRYIRM
jgi:site-specific recombinase XerD